MVKFEFVEENEASETQAFETKNIDFKTILKPKKNIPIKDPKEVELRVETPKKPIINLDISLNASARLNLIKFLYPLFNHSLSTSLLFSQYHYQV